MALLKPGDYEYYIKEMGAKFKSPNVQWPQWYTQFCYYEEKWDSYYKEFLLEIKKNQNKPIQFVLWESCPGGMPFPHQNYVFDDFRYKNQINGVTDKYLKNVCVRNGIAWKNKEIGNIIEELQRNQILIIDLYPTHGISLDSTNRQNLLDKIFDKYSIKKLEKIGNDLTNYLKNRTILISNELEIIAPKTNDISRVLKLNGNPILDLI
jgi:hypothetical protein